MLLIWHSSSNRCTYSSNKESSGAKKRWRGSARIGCIRALLIVTGSLPNALDVTTIMISLATEATAQVRGVPIRAAMATVVAPPTVATAMVTTTIVEGTKKRLISSVLAIDVNTTARSLKWTALTNQMKINVTDTIDVRKQHMIRELSNANRWQLVIMSTTTARL